MASAINSRPNTPTKTLIAGCINSVMGSTSLELLITPPIGINANPHTTSARITTPSRLLNSGYFNHGMTPSTKAMPPNTAPTSKLPSEGTYTFVVDSFDAQSVGEYSIAITYISDCANGEPAAIVSSANTRVNLRTGPDTTYPAGGIVRKNDCLVVIGPEKSGSWLQVQTESSRIGWIRIDLVEVFGDLSGVPVSAE